MFEVNGVSFLYTAYGEANADVQALTDVNVKIDKGDFVVILGRNGSGK